MVPRRGGIVFYNYLFLNNIMKFYVKNVTQNVCIFVIQKEHHFYVFFKQIVVFCQM